MADEPTAPPPSRTLWVLLLVLCSLWIGLVAGAAIGANLFVPAGSGFAAGPTTLGYGVIGSLTAACMAVVLAWKLPSRSIRRLALLAILLSAVIAAFIGYRISRLRTARLAGAGNDTALIAIPNANP